VSELYYLMQKEYESQRELQEWLRAEAESLPAGTLSFSVSKGKEYINLKVRTKSGKMERRHLSQQRPEDVELAHKISHKRYIIELLKILDKNVSALEECIKKYKRFDPVEIAENLPKAYRERWGHFGMKCGQAGKRQDQPGIKNGQTGKRQDQPGMWNDPSGIREGQQVMRQDRLDRWKETAAAKGIRQVSVDDISFRSKSEQIIGLVLEKHGILFEYERSIKANGIAYRPDFTIRHPQTGQLIYYEHMGMMDQPGYTESAVRKLMDYWCEGIQIGKNLILTFETRDEPLSVSQIEQLIKEHLS